MKTALITGITGQDGSYLAELLLSKGYQVCGLVLPDGREPLDNISHLLSRVYLIAGDLTSQPSLEAAVDTAAPHEVYNLAAQSFVPVSWTKPVMTADITGLGAVRLLEAVRRKAPQARVFQASSAALFGKPEHSPQSEKTPIRPDTPYGASKAFAHFLAGQYREAHKLHVSCGILYNHESVRRGPDFVTRKVSLAAARIKLGLQSELKLGSTDAVRDWGFAGDYVDAMWRMLQQDEAGDYVIASGEAHTVQDLVDVAFEAAGLDPDRYLTRDESLVRAEGGMPLVGDSRKARVALEWAPRVDFKRMIEEMVAHDLKTLQKEVQPA